jgi:hypothetical protein
MKCSPAVFTLATLLSSFTSPAAEAHRSASPPGEVTYSLPSSARVGSAGIGDIDTLQFHLAFVESFAGPGDARWLAGVDWRRLQLGLSPGAPLPDALQSTAAVVGLDTPLGDRWRLRVEVFPGVYSDFEDIDGDDLNAPFSIELTYELQPDLVVGAQFSADARRDSPFVGSVGVGWRFAERWRLALWIPRPQVEFLATERTTLFAGASLAGGTYRVARDFGRRVGRAQLDDTLIDYREIRVGAGARYHVAGKLALEVAGGWTVDRRFHFHQRDLLVNGDGAPYVQCSFGLTF